MKFCQRSEKLTDALTHDNLRNMNREIKFRYWDGEKKEMVYKCPDHNNCETLQYIGLEDIDGVQIYEGDIITCTTIYRGINFLVQYRVDSEFCGFLPVEREDRKETDPMSHFVPWDKCKVIGNIFQNRELLTNA